MLGRVSKYRYIHRFPSYLAPKMPGPGDAEWNNCWQASTVVVTVTLMRPHVSLQ